MVLCKVNNIINFYTDFGMGICYYLWQVMAKEFRSDTLDVAEKEMESFWRCSCFYPFWIMVEFYMHR